MLKLEFGVAIKQKDKGLLDKPQRPISPIFKIRPLVKFNLKLKFVSQVEVGVLIHKMKLNLKLYVEVEG